VHTRAHREGLQDISKARTAIKMRSGNTETTAKTGTLKGTICDQHGNELNKAMIEKVSYLPNGTFNIFSLTLMMSKGWKMGGNKDSIWIEEDQKKVIFDMEISTPNRGTVFAMHFARDTKTSDETKSLKVGEGMKNEKKNLVLESKKEK
jgi:hypothetical protein